MVVMVVEDNPVSARVLESILHGAGHDAVVAPSCSLARRILDVSPDVELIVCDVELPDGSGLDLVIQLKSGPHARIPVIMCTGSDDPATVRAAIQAGCCSYVLKPVNATRLLERVAACAPGPAAQARSP